MAGVLSVSRTLGDIVVGVFSCRELAARRYRLLMRCLNACITESRRAKIPELCNPPVAQRAGLVYLLTRDATQVHANLQGFRDG